MALQMNVTLKPVQEIAHNYNLNSMLYPLNIKITSIFYD